jgi:hypothetical protein
MEESNTKQFTANYKNKRYAAGLCIECGKPRQDANVRCGACREAQSVYRKGRLAWAKENRRCTRCSKPLEEGAIEQTCLDCWFSRIAVIALGSRTRGKELKQLFEKQGGRCFYTDEILIPGGNASIDHQIPPCRGGDHSSENMRWVTNDINRIKGKMAHEEFVAMCQHIAQKFS